MFTMRFDMRVPDSGASTSTLYAAALEMCAWAETRGGVAAVLSEHHGTEDGHLPSPLILASAIAARTQRLAIILAAVVLPFADPVRLAEEINVLDVISYGRVCYAFGVGHRAEEYEHFGLDIHSRGRLADEKLALLLQLLKGEPVTYDGRRIHATPPPLTGGGPTILVAGASPSAVRRAARHGLGFLGHTHAAGLKELYEQQCRAHGHQPGPTQFPEADAPTAVFVAEDPDRAWDELGPYLLHDAVTAAAYRNGDDTVSSITRAKTVSDLRATSGPYLICSTEDAEARLRSGQSLQLLPLCGGLPPELAWPYLERAAAAVAHVGSQRDEP